MVELTKQGRALIEALVGGPVAWRSPRELARAVGLGPEEVGDLLADLDAGGWLSAWERPDDLVVTLSVEAASRLGVRLVEFGMAETPRWARRADPEPPPPRATGLFRGERAASLELVHDPRPRPEALAELSGQADASAASAAGGAEADALPRPTILVGTGLSPWPGPGPGAGGPCPACGSGPLGPSMYCLHCDRWGLDHLARPRPAPRPSARAAAGEPSLRAEQQRRARKAKRRARRAAQAGGPGRPRRASS